MKNIRKGYVKKIGFTSCIIIQLAIGLNFINPVFAQREAIEPNQNNAVTVSSPAPAPMINLGELAPADQITVKNGTVEIGSSDVPTAVTNILIKEGLMTVPQEIGDVKNATVNSTNSSFLGTRNVETDSKAALTEHALPGTQLDLAVRDVIQSMAQITTISSTFKPSVSSGSTAPAQNSGSLTGLHGMMESAGVNASTL